MKNKPLVHLVTDEEVQGQAKELFEQMKAATGQVPDWMRVMANCPDTLVGFFTLFRSVMDNAPLDKILKWKVAYLVSEINKCDFCVGISKMKLKEFGLAEEEIGNIEKGCGERECVALEFAKSTTLHAYKIDPQILEKLKEHFTDEQIVELTAVIGLFNFANRFNDALGVLPKM